MYVCIHIRRVHLYSFVRTTYMHTCIYTNVRTYIRRYVRTCYIITHCISLYMHISIHIYICLFASTYIHAHTHKHTYMHVYTHIHVDMADILEFCLDLIASASSTSSVACLAAKLLHSAGCSSSAARQKSLSTLQSLVMCRNSKW